MIYFTKYYLVFPTNLPFPLLLPKRDNNQVTMKIAASFLTLLASANAFSPNALPSTPL